jgi:hypothetical protein
MPGMSRSSAWLLGSLLTLVAACAEGGSVEDGSGGAGGSGSGGDPGSTTSGSTASATSTTSGSTTAATTGSGGSGGDMTTTSTSSGQVCDFTTLDTCQTADPMSPLAADKDQTPVVKTGVGEAWFEIHMEEQDSSVFGEDLSYRVSLTSPPGMNYDLVVLEGPQNGSPDCNATPKTGTGEPATVSASWGDDQGFGGEDDSLWLVIHVVYVSGDSCGPTDQWTLKVEGHI